jgi:hypothetical protein
MSIVRIAGIDYSIELCDPSQMQDGGRLGEADFNRQVIRINNTVTDQTKQIATIHEVLHMIDHAYGTNLTEQQIVIFTHGLVQFVKDNPTFFNEVLV